MLDLSPSTYEYYESTRVPPATVLLRIAEAAGVQIHWLLTGESASPAVPADHPILQRAAALLARHPGAAAPLTAFVELLAGAMAFPQKHKPEVAPDPTAEPAAAQATGRPQPDVAPQAGWIPILGRSAAGIVQFWTDQAEAAGVTRLAELIARQGRRQHVRQATVASPEVDVGESVVQLVTLRSPDEADVVEFVASPSLKQRYPDAFALRIDGESMSPDIRHGDIVVLSPTAPAADGHAAVVQLRGQVGVTCKLFRPVDDVVHLIPLNEQSEVQAFPADSIVWAFRVLGRVRS